MKAIATRIRSSQPGGRLEMLSIAAAVMFLCVVGCGCEPEGASDLTRFDHMEQADLTIGDSTFRAWVAKTDKDRASGFMYVEAELLETLPDGAYPAMIFLFRTDRSKYDGFWMKNVPVPLDIAFIDSEKRIVTVKTMAAYDYHNTFSDGDYRYALEVRAGLFSKLEIAAGDTVDIPESILNSIQ